MKDLDIAVDVFKRMIRSLFSPLYCSKGKHRWKLSAGMAMYCCKDCYKYISVEEYRSK